MFIRSGKRPIQKPYSSVVCSVWIMRKSLEGSHIHDSWNVISAEVVKAGYGWVRCNLARFIHDHTLFYVVASYIDLLTDWFNWVIDWLTDNWLINWWIDSLVGGLIVRISIAQTFFKLNTLRRQKYFRRKSNRISNI